MGDKVKSGYSTFKQDVNAGMNDPKAFTKTATFKVLMIIIALILSAIAIYFLYKFLMSDDNDELKEKASEFV